MMLSLREQTKVTSVLEWNKNFVETLLGMRNIAVNKHPDLRKDTDI